MITKNIITLTDEGLLNRSRYYNDEKAFREIFDRYWAKLFLYAFNVLKEKETCEDIVQTIFIDLWTRKDNIEIENLSAYLYKAVKFQIFKRFRDSKITVQHEEHFMLTKLEHNMTEQIEANELSAHIRNFIDKLPQQRKVIFELSRFENLSNKEISEKLNISLQTVKNQISSAIKYLRKSIQLFILLF